MKKVILFLAAAICSVLMMAQTNQVTWVNGRAVLGQSISSIDSIKYGVIEDADQLVLWLPKTIIVHDTIYDIIHEVIHDTIFKRVRDKAPEGVEMVDLGLPSGIKWANMNVGATKPEEYGDYFAWGETEPKDVYDWSTYKWCNGSYDTQTKYCTSSSYGTVDNKTTLEPEDDAAHVNWGGNWRMPTKAEQDELRNTDNCTWEWKTNYNGTGVNGYLVTSKKNGNSIFLPASGYRCGSSVNFVGSYGYYWSSSLDEGDSNYAHYLYFNSDYVGWHVSSRYDGLSVRPVCQW